ncbi:MAG: Pr6Pr family membrane protein [Ignavibacteria bacterium]|nr:Pr6Pr family membrane protein [Ignavibacteria bacterium]
MSAYSCAGFISFVLDIFVPKGELKFSISIHWLIYPLIYLLYTLIRGAFTGLYPYFFMNAGKLGYPVVFRNSGFITAGYIIIGLLVILSDKYFFHKTDKID